VSAALRELSHAYDHLDGGSQTARTIFDGARLGRCAQAAEVAQRSLHAFLVCMASYGDAIGASDAIEGL
jgi:hypothetical protein